MKLRPFMLCAMLALPLAAEPAERPSFGVVAADMTPELRTHAGIPHGVLVRAVQPGSPAEQAGVRTGVVILALNDTPVEHREGMLAFLNSHKPGDVVEARLMYRNGRTETVRVVLEPRSKKAADIPGTPDSAVGGDRVMRPLTIRSDVREQLRAQRNALRAILQSLPEGMDANRMIKALNTIRDVARDANPYGGDGWMVGKAGDVSVQFRDREGVLLLRGANNILTLEVFDTNGCKIFTAPVTTPQDCAALPAHLLERLKAL